MRRIVRDVFLDEKRMVVCKYFRGFRSAQLSQEFENYKKLEKIRLPATLRVPAVRLQKDHLEMAYIDGENMASVLKPERYRAFGQALREFHEQGHTHGHLEAQDVIFSQGVFFIVDFTFLDTKMPGNELAHFYMSLQLWKIKRPLHWKAYSRCADAFLKGYAPKKKDVRRDIQKEYAYIQAHYAQQGFTGKVRSAILRLVFGKAFRGVDV